MEATALLLSRIQFAATISFHIIFPSFTIGLAAWLAVLEAMSLATGNRVYHQVYEFWLKIFGVAFGMGVVSGIVMAFQFGTNWSELSRASGPIQGPLLTYESFTAFALEATFFGVMLFGRKRVRPWFYLMSCILVAAGTTMSAFWILVNNSWMQHPVGFVVQNGIFVPTDWAAIIFNHVVWVRFPHMLLGAYLTTAFCVAAVGATYLLKERYRIEAMVMVRMSLGLATVLVPLQILFGHLTGDYIHDDQPAKFAAVEGRWVDEQPAAEVIFAIPDADSQRNRLEWKVPVLGSLIASGTLDSREVGLTDFPAADRPPVLIPFFAFRVMAGCGVLMLALAWIGTAVARRGKLKKQRWLLWPLAFSFPLGFIAILAGWFTAEVGRQPWTVWGVLRTADALTPGLTPHFAAATLVMYVSVYAFIFCFGVYYILRIVRRGVFDGKVLTIWNGHVIPQTYDPGAQLVKPARSRVSNV
ncbi:Cytochrome bd-II ubiquinol oxidase subunit 1 [Paraburkholderia ultramafica]|uniref:Cytochrome bd-II ubiquinol oxidase subunit 1 n=1 Tax=Paraburkholderia ultramafica TaxID=1544867 RepID=A0A6S7B6S3_9BURK|nr:cytochrome ubiquinol oxidase subunit I [Paraburkholderia ultramafica]CAB3779477.1 Cytochrome bd-II ubiquinol oxidase subunit 1 [Paraburkholderia ultramafica]